MRPISSLTATSDPRVTASSGRGGGPLTAFVLHRYDWSESSLVLELFTLEQGRLTVVAKGAKRPYSQLRSVLLPFQRIMVGLTKGAAGRSPGPHAATPDIQSLRSAEWAGGAAMFNGAALFSGFYLNELLLKLLPRHEASPPLFDAYMQAMKALHLGDDAASQAALRAFEMRLLSEMGVLPDLSVCTLTQQLVRPEARYRLTPEGGVIDGVGQGPGPSEALPGTLLVALQAALVHGGFNALQHACGTELNRLKGALRGLLHYHLGSSTLRTRQLLLDLQAIERI